MDKSKAASLRSSIPNVKAKSASSPRAMRTRPKAGRIISFTLDPNNLPKLTWRGLTPRTEAYALSPNNKQKLRTAT
jgi:hypothetical protein